MNRSHIVCALAVCGLAATTLGLWHAQAGDAKSQPAAGFAAPAASIKTLAETTAVLSQAADLPDKYDGSVKELFTLLDNKFGVTFRLDPVVFNKSSGEANAYELKVQIAHAKGLTVRDVLEEFYHNQNTLETKLGLHVKAGQILITRGFIPPTTPGQYKTGDAPSRFVPDDQLMQMLSGPTVNLAVQDKTLTELVHLLREQSGANIVLDPRCGNLADKKLTLTFNDAKLRTVLKLAANLCDLGVAVVDNAFIVTDAVNAEELMTETDLTLFGKPPEPVKKGK